VLDEDIFMYGEDIDWCWRVKLAGWRVTYVPGAVVYHYHGASSRFRPAGAALDLRKGMAVFYRKHLAAQHGRLFNALVYSAIWARAAVFVTLGALRSLLPRRRVVRVVRR
jgi:GT2 family glycosyltransferase